MKFTRILSLCLSLIITAFTVVKAQVGIGTTTPNASAALDIDVSTLPSNSKKGLLLPRVNLLNIADILTIPNPANGLLAYNKTAAGISPNNVIGNYIYSWRGTRWDRFSNLPEVKQAKIPLDFAIAGKTKQTFSSTEINSLNAVDVVNSVPIVWNTATDVIIANPSNVELINSIDIKILTSALYQISGMLSFHTDSKNIPTNCVVTLQRSTDNGNTWNSIIGSAIPFEQMVNTNPDVNYKTNIDSQNKIQTIVFPDSIKRFEQGDLLRFVISRQKNPYTGGQAPANYGTNSGIQTRLINDTNKSFRFTRLSQ